MATTTSKGKSSQPASKRFKSPSGANHSSTAAPPASQQTTVSTTPPGGSTPERVSSRVCSVCGGKKAPHAAMCRVCYSKARTEATIVLKCDCCGKSFVRSAAEHQKSRDRHGKDVRVFCSRPCYDLYKIDNPVAYSKVKGECLRCQKPVTGTDRSKFCSKACYNEYRASRRQTDAYNGEFLTLKKQVLQRDKRCLLCGTTHARFEAHHINEDSTDNRISNLVQLCTACHRKYHQFTESVRATLQGCLRRLISS